MSDIIIRDGKLWKNGVQLTLEFGNTEQINAIRKYEKKFESFRTGKVVPIKTYNITGTAIFECLCGRTLETDPEEADYDGDESCFENTKKKCGLCKREYLFVLEKTYGMQMKKRVVVNEKIFVKLIN